MDVPGAEQALYDPLEKMENFRTDQGTQATITTSEKQIQTSKQLSGVRTYTRSTQVDAKQKWGHDKATQCEPPDSTYLGHTTTGTQTTIDVTPSTEDSDEEMESDCSDCEDGDPDYDFVADCKNTGNEYSDDDNEFEENVNEELLNDVPPIKERKFIVFESCLKMLLSVCFVCLGTCKVYLLRLVGSMAVLEQVCENGHHNIWHSQPSLQSMPAGNLLIASGIFFSGSSSVRCLNMFHHLKIPTISLSTYHLMQRCYLVSSVLRVWERKQMSLLSEVKNDAMKLGGDARCCSPGHTAKYGSYTLMDLVRSKVVDMQLVQSNEVRNSNAMELEGLKRGLAFLKDKGINIKSLTTDRHVGVKKYMRENMPTVDHWFDVWHVAKGVKKKLDAKAKRKCSAILGDWSRSISNHVYWCAASSAGDSNLVKAKWLSVARHAANKHEGHGDLFPACVHDELADRRWIQEGSKPHKELIAIVEGKALLRDIGQLSPAEQTSSLEAFHKVIIFFAPKSVHFTFHAMKARILLATIHFNENSARAQAVTKKGHAQWGISFPKARQGEAVLKAVKVAPMYSYIQELLEEVLLLRAEYPSYRKAETLVQQRQAPPPVSSKHQKPGKLQLVERHHSRFNISTSVTSNK